MGNNEVKIIVTTDASGAITGIKTAEGQFVTSTQKMQSETQSLAASSKSAWGSISGAIDGAATAIKAFLAYEVIQKGAEFMKMAADAQQAEASFKSVTQSFGIDAEDMMNKMKAASMGMIESSDLAQRAVQGLALGLKDNQIVGLLEASRSAAKVWGKDMGETFDQFVVAVGGGVRALGPLVRTGMLTKEEFKLVNQAIAAGIDDFDVYSLVVEKAAIMEGRLSNAEMDAKEKMQAFHAQVKELKETLGGWLMAALGGVLGLFQMMAAQMLRGAASAFEFASAIGSITDALHRSEGAADRWKERQATALLAAQDLEKKAKEKFGVTDPRPDDSAGRAEKAAAAQEKLNKQFADLKSKLDALKASTAEDPFLIMSRDVEKFADRVTALNPDLDETEKKLAEWYNAASDMARKIYDNPKLTDGQKDQLAQRLSDSVTKGAEYIETEGKSKMGAAYAQLQDEIMGITGTGQQKELAANQVWLDKQLELFKHNVDAQNEAREAAGIRGSQINQKYVTEDMRFELEMGQQANAALLADKLDGFTQQEAMYKDLHDHMLISDQEFFAKMKELTKAQTDAKIQSLSDQFQAFIDERSEEIAADGTTDDERKIAYKELTKAAQEYYIAIGATAREGADQISQINRDAANAAGQAWTQFGRDASQSISDGLLNGFKDTGKQLLDIFKRFLSQMIQTALVNPIIIPMMASAQGALTGGQVAGVQGPIGNMLGTGMLGSTLGGYLGAGAMGAGIGTMVGGSSMGGAIGGLAGFGLGTAFSATIAAGISSLLPRIAISASIGGPIGLAIGALIGAVVGGLFQDKPDYGEMAMGYKTGAPQGKNQDGEWMRYTSGQFTASTNKSDTGWPLTDAQLQAVSKGFEAISSAVEDKMTALGMDLSGFSKTWSEQIDLTGLDEKGRQAKIQQWIDDFLGNIVGPDTQAKIQEFSKSGETFAQTLDRVLSALQAMPEESKNIELMIKAIQGNYTAAAQWQDQMDAANQNITDLQDKMSKATDPTDVLNYEQQLKAAIVKRYEDEVNFVTQLQATIDQFGQAIRAANEDMMSFDVSMQQKIDNLTGSNNTAGLIQSQIPSFLSDFNAASTPDERLSLIGKGQGMVDSWLSSTISQIQSQARSWTVTAPGNEGIIQPQIDAVNLQLQAIQGWKSLLDNINKTILSLSESTANPQNALELMGIGKAEAERLKALYEGATGADKVTYAQQYSDALQTYLKLASDAGTLSADYQRPGSGYKEVYAFVMGQLKDIQGVAATQSESEKQTELQKQLVRLQGQIVHSTQVTMNNSAQINSQIRAANLQAEGYYKWLKDQGDKAYKDKITADAEAQAEAKTLLETVTEGLGATGWLAQRQQEAVDALSTLNSTMIAFYNGFMTSIGSTARLAPEGAATDANPSSTVGDIPSAANEGFVSRPQLVMVGDAHGEVGEWILHDSTVRRLASRGSGGILIAPQITVHVEGGDASPQELARELKKELENIMIDSIRSGRVRTAVKDVVKYG